MRTATIFRNPRRLCNLGTYSMGRLFCLRSAADQRPCRRAVSSHLTSLNLLTFFGSQACRMGEKDERKILKERSGGGGGGMVDGICWRMLIRPFAPRRRNDRPSPPRISAALNIESVRYGNSKSHKSSWQKSMGLGKLTRPSRTMKLLNWKRFLV